MVMFVLFRLLLMMYPLPWSPFREGFGGRWPSVAYLRHWKEKMLRKCENKVLQSGL